MENKSNNEEEEKRKALEELLGNLLSGLELQKEFINKNKAIEDEDDSEFGKLINVEVINEGDWVLKFKTWENSSGNIIKVTIKKLNGDIPKELPDFISKIVDAHLPKMNKFSLLKDETNGLKMDSIFNKPNFINGKTLSEFDNDKSIKGLVVRFWGENGQLNFDKELGKAVDNEDYSLAAKFRDKNLDLVKLKKETLNSIKESLDNEDIMGIDMLLTCFKEILEEIKKN